MKISALKRHGHRHLPFPVSHLDHAFKIRDIFSNRHITLSLHTLGSLLYFLGPTLVICVLRIFFGEPLPVAQPYHLVSLAQLIFDSQLISICFLSVPIGELNELAVRRFATVSDLQSRQILLRTLRSRILALF